MDSELFPKRASTGENETGVIQLYIGLLDSWNRRSAADFAARFTLDGSMVGFDGSSMNGRAEIEAHIQQVFTDHVTATYVSKIREVRFLAADVALLRAVAGLIPPGQTDLNPATNAIQSLIALRMSGEWRVALFQNTPAQFHGRPDLAEALTRELRQLL